tara:strand:+ start:481 stop:705 length:225 start_codon:yes stop_codon:yes gene_type:complete
MIDHLRKNNQSYLNHLKLAWIVAFHMLFSLCFLLVHGVMPFIPIPKLFTIEGMTRKMKKWDSYLKINKLKKEKR